MMIGGREQFAARRAIRLWRSLSRSIHRARSAGRMAISCLRPLSELTSSSNPQAGGVSSTELTMTSGIVSCGPKASNTCSRREDGHLKSEIRTAILRAAPSDDAAAMNPSAPRPAHIVARTAPRRRAQCFWNGSRGGRDPRAPSCHTQSGRNGRQSSSPNRPMLRHISRTSDNFSQAPTNAIDAETSTIA